MIFRINKLNLKYVFLFVAIAIGIGYATLMAEPPILLASALILWALCVVYCLNDIRDNIVLFCFLISFYVFLLGREVAFYYLGLEEYYLYLTPWNDYAYKCVILSLIGLMMGVVLHYNFRKDSTISVYKSRAKYTTEFKTVSKYIFYFCYLFLIVLTIYQIRFVRRVGYLGSYTDDYGSSGAPSFVAYIGAFAIIALCLFLATLPSKREAIPPLVLFLLYGALSLLTGQRYPFVAVCLIVLIYLTIRNKSDDIWISKRIVIIILVAIPLLVAFLSIYDSYRVDGKISLSTFSSTLISFFDSQGGSINNIKRIRYFEEYLTDLKFVSFDSTRTVLSENLIMRNLFDIQVYSGNSLEHALNGHSISHRLSYLTYDNYYLSGMGVGSCYIAELAHDFGYIGILLGSVFYGFLMRAISTIKFDHYFKDGLLLAILYYILLAPRGGFDEFVGGVFSLSSVFGLIIMYLVSREYNRRNRQQVMR